VHTPQIVDHIKIDSKPQMLASACGNSLRVVVTARVELRGLEPLTL